jgi:hypothetical protein
MSGEGLVELARKYVALSDQLEAVRGQIERTVANGAAGEAARPTQPARSSGGSQHPNALKAVEAEALIIERLRDRPGMGTAELARATDSKVNTTTERLKRMKAKGLIERQDGREGGWTAP